MEEKDQEDVMTRLLELGTDKKFLTFDDLNRELPDNMVSPDDIEDVLHDLALAHRGLRAAEDRRPARSRQDQHPRGRHLLRAG
ncbi:MAG: hypothetical protein LC774_13135 [Acidobacteria bacterium]|nr:hypothetical protein [Acidobacteriota bacterium]